MCGQPQPVTAHGGSARGPDLLHRKAGVQMHRQMSAEPLPHGCLCHPPGKEALVSVCQGVLCTLPGVLTALSLRGTGQQVHCHQPCRTALSPPISRLPTPARLLEGPARLCRTVHPPRPGQPLTYFPSPRTTPGMRAGQLPAEQLDKGGPLCMSPPAVVPHGADTACQWGPWGKADDTGLNQQRPAGPPLVCVGTLKGLEGSRLEHRGSVMNGSHLP